MANKKSNAAALKEKRRAKLEKQKKRTDLIAYIVAGVAVAAIVAILIISFI